MNNERIATMQEALEAIGIKTQKNGVYRQFNDVMSDLQDKWHSLDQDSKQTLANAFVKCML